MFKDICDTSLSNMAFMTLANISIGHAEHFVKHLNRCLKAWEQIPYTVASACKIIASIGRVNKKEAERCLKIFFGKVNSIDPMWISVILMEVKRIGQAHKECLDVYRPQIEKLKTCQQMGVPDMVQSMIDFLDDRSLHGLSEEVAEQREDIDNLDSRVTNTENDVTRIDETVDQQGDEIQNVKNEVNEQGEKLDELKEVVDETVENVEEIDHKTITNAPKWSRDVSKMLNPEHEHDWRFLAVRLGYSGEDIRNWALSPDPTMAILAEWYTTHKSSDAAYAILSALEDMGRTDATEIITQSLEEAELLLPQASPDESDKPPTVFLSYQWDHQPEVKAIKKHLEMAGFPCWMDIGQMGEGDQLFAKISQGMRSSKLVLCMVTEKYSNSENCNKEVNLANLLNKPIIPILIDQTQWPPQGAMSMLFAQLLFIQFYNDKEYVRGEKFWEDAKFSELLGQISYHANPDESMISDEYRDWIPQVEDKPVTVKKVSEEAKSSHAQQNQTMESTEAPSIFISYQWDKQPEIKRLFSRLTGLGYHCWLDINQMGGGDPLYSKIDKGVRNAKVVVSCVTPKYSLSANCRREISLSDALRKPIIPLLLEEMTWPPEGPMSMTITQLLYIDFTKKTTQASFDDDKFEELIEKIKEHAEPTLQVVPPGKQDETKVTSQEQSPTPTPKEEGTTETSEIKDIPSSADASESDTKPVEEVPAAVEGSATPQEQASSPQQQNSPAEAPTAEQQDEMKLTSQEQSPTATPKEEGTAETSETKDIPSSADASESDTKPVEEGPVAPPAEQPSLKQSDKSPVKKPSSLPPSEKKNKKSSTCLLL
ncbi:uncharacterized protein LOC100894022 [Strongylocentrotus purpuratus]|uniref:Uncharacterized protein n=1 Tax=Strongylocentrotus purpuratus TaxID=7668 RepID=A0A7M7PLS1_STRPU|nr:uncharacterized protein LOC100894022 [Strongylocentrotus purpuratus]